MGSLNAFFNAQKSPNLGKKHIKKLNNLSTTLYVNSCKHNIIYYNMVHLFECWKLFRYKIESNKIKLTGVRKLLHTTVVLEFWQNLFLHKLWIKFHFKGHTFFTHILLSPKKIRFALIQNFLVICKQWIKFLNVSLNYFD